MSAKKSTDPKTTNDSSSKATDPRKTAHLPKPDLSDYAQQFRDAIELTRSSIFHSRKTAVATNETALGALDISRRTFADARGGLVDAYANLTISAFLERKLTDANLTALNLVSLADNANQKAIAAATAIGVAATSIKAASAAMDAVSRDVGGASAIASTKDGTEPLNAAAIAAIDAVKATASAVERLKCEALKANVQAAQPRTGVLLQAVQANQKSIGGLLTTFTKELEDDITAVTTAHTARATDLIDLFGKSETYLVSSGDDQALSAAVTTIDGVENATLTVTVKNPDDGETTDEKDKDKDKNKAKAKVVKTRYGGFQATVDATKFDRTTTKAIVFFAVPADQASSFGLARAIVLHSGKEDPEKDEKDDKDKGDKEVVRNRKEVPLSETSEAVVETYSADLFGDTDGKAIALGADYAVFFLRVPRTGDPVATDLSLPSPTITSHFPLQFAERVPTKEDPKPAALGGAPQLFALPGEAFVAVVATIVPARASYVDRYELYFSPAETYEEAKGAEYFIARALNAASYTEINAENAPDPDLDPEAKGHADPATIVAAIEAQYRREMGLIRTYPDEQITKAFEKVVGGAESLNGNWVLVYFNALGVQEGWQPVKDKDEKDDKKPLNPRHGYFAARFTDMYGDLFDLEYRAYRGLVLAVGKETDGVRPAADTLSQPTKDFPPEIQVVPLPTDLQPGQADVEPALTTVPPTKDKTTGKAAKS